MKIKEFVINIYERIPLEARIPTAALLILIILLILFFRIRLRTREILNKFSMGKSDLSSKRFLKRHPHLTWKFILQSGTTFIALFDLEEFILKQFVKRPTHKNARRVLDNIPNLGSFSVFLEARTRRSVAKVLYNWLNREESEPLNSLVQLAHSSKGEGFNGAWAQREFSKHLDSIREISVFPDWESRLFAIRILLFDKTERSQKIVEEAFHDSQALIRRLAAQDSHFSDSEKHFDLLYKLVLDDPVSAVRQTARTRIAKLFPEKWKIDPLAFTVLQAVHVLDLLRMNSKEDENLALTMLKGDAPESRIPAARYLSKIGRLEQILNTANRGDREDWNRRLEILSVAVRSGEIEFLKRLRFTDSPDILLLGARLLCEIDDETLVDVLTEKVLRQPKPFITADQKELYTLMVNLACEKGSTHAQALIRKELYMNRTNADSMKIILPALMPENAPLFREILLMCFSDSEFPAEKELLELFARMESFLFLGPILDVLDSKNDDSGKIVQRRAIWCLGQWHTDNTLQIILENLYILPQNELRKFSIFLDEFDEKALEEKIRIFLQSPDSNFRASLIAALPKRLYDSFFSDIQENLTDPNPNVRIACIQFLSTAQPLSEDDFVETLTGDPDEQVREEAVSILSEKEFFLEKLESLLNNIEEPLSVRVAVLHGLASVPSEKNVEILLRFLSSGKEDMRHQTIETLSTITDEECIKAMVREFENSGGILRERILEVFSAMREKGEALIIDLLKTSDTSLQPLWPKILTQAGYVEKFVRDLRNRNADIRRKAASSLALIDDESAYRGLILAARDPDKSIRILAVQALEKMAKEEDSPILETLKNDPDPTIRRHTQWAMARLKAGRLP